jgi:uncharacterized protein YbcI
MVGRTEAPLTQAISDAVARLYLDKFGKGPLHTETCISGDVITTVMHDIFNPVEHELIAAGKEESVLANRMLWQRATDDAFKALIGSVVDRRVLTVISGFEVNDEVAVEVFLMSSLD